MTQQGRGRSRIDPGVVSLSVRGDRPIVAVVKLFEILVSVNSPKRFQMSQKGSIVRGLRLSEQFQNGVGGDRTVVLVLLS